MKRVADKLKVAPAAHARYGEAAARKPLPVDHPTSALAYRIKELTTPKRQRRAAPSMDPYPRPSQQQSGPSLGM